MSTVATMGINIIGDVSGLKKALGDAQGSMRSAADGMKAAGGALTAGVTLPLVGIGAAALKMSTDLNSGMANVASMGVGSARILELKANVQDMAVAVGKSTTDLTGGLYQVESAFGDSAETAKILEINAKSAAAGLASTTEAINLTSAVTKGYGDTSAAAVQAVSDMALKTVALGQTTFPELAASMGQVVPLASNLGIAQKELFAVMATGTGVTGNAAAVATQMRGSMQSLMAPTKSMTALFQEQGFASGEAMLKQLGYAGTMQAIVKAATDSGQPLQAYMGSIEGQTLALALAGPLADQYKSKLAAMGDAAGATDAAFAAQTKGVNSAGFAMQQAQIKLEVFMQKIGDGLGPAVLAVTNAIAPMADQLLGLADAFAKADPGTQTMIVGAVALAAAAGPLLMALGAVTSALAVLVSPIGLVVAAVALLGVAWATNFGGIQEKTAQMWAVVQPVFQQMTDRFNAVVTAFQSGSTSFTGIFGELGASLLGINTDVYDTTDSIREFVIALTGSVPAANGVDTALQAMSGVITQLQATWAQLVTFFAPSIANLQAAFAGLPASMAPMLPALQGLLGAFQGMWTAVQPIVTALGSMVMAVFAVEGVASINMFAAILQNLGPIATAVINNITLTINTIATVLTQVTALVQAIAKGDWAAAWTAFQNIERAMVELILGNIRNMQTIAQGIFNIFRSAITSTLKSMGVDVDGIMKNIKNTWDGIWKSLSDSIAPVSNALNSFRDNLKAFLDWIPQVPNPFAAWTFTAPWSTPAPATPGSQLGRSNWYGGATLVGESGPEIVNLPRGAEIIPNRASNRFGGGNTFTINVTAQTPVEIEALAHKIEQIARRRN